MATATRKWKDAQSFKSSMKRLRIEPSAPASPEAAQLDDIEDDEEGSYHEEFEFSQEEEPVDTPATSFSPASKKFPSQLKTLECTYEGCDKTFNRPVRLATHLRSHTNEKPFKCNHEGCDKAYTDDKHLKQHIKSAHSQERPYSCEWEGCTKKFLTGTRLRRHQLVHEGQNRFRCTAYPPCNETFRKHQTLERHIRSDHFGLTPFPCTFIDSYTSEACNSGFDGSVGLRKHMERVHGILEFFCPECIVPDSFSLDGGPLHLGFTTNASLQAHIKKDHANCPFCDKKCASKRELDKHVESQHSGIPVEQRKIKSCSHLGCTKTFTKTANLNAHIRAVHEGQRYICGTFDVIKTADLASWDGENACGEALVSKANLEDHIRTAHLGLRSLINSRRKRRSSEAEDDSEAPPRAKKGKKSKPSALEELLGVTPEADDHRNISCIVPDCPKKFIREHDLQNHIRTKHRPASREVQDQDDIGAGVKIKLESSDIDDRDEEDRVQRDLMDDQADLDWELQTHASEGGQFWVGAGDFVAEEDQWVLDEAEMRRLIDEAVLRRNLS